MTKKIIKKLLVVRAMPKKLEEQYIYHNVGKDVISYLCPCGCGRETHINVSGRYNHRATTDHRFGVNFLTLHPSVLQTGTACQSHYWLKENEFIFC